jgi:hypothetical protein
MITPSPADNFVTYPLLQMGAGLPVLVEELNRILAAGPARAAVPRLGRGAGLARRYLVLVGSVMTLGAALPVPLAARVLWSGAAMVVAGAAAWRLLLDRMEREIVSREVAAMWARVRSFPT